MNNKNAPLKTAFTITINPDVSNKMGSKTLIKQSFKKIRWLLTTYVKRSVCTMEFTKKGIPHFHGWYEDEDIDESQFHLLIHSMTYKNKFTFFGFILLKPADELKGWEEYMFKNQQGVRSILKKLNLDSESCFTHTRKTVTDMIKIDHKDLDETQLTIKELILD